MSFISTLFGGGKSEPRPMPAPAAPRIGDADVAALGREEAARMRRKKGTEDTILAGGLGDVGAPSAAIQRTSLLGGG